MRSRHGQRNLAFHTNGLLHCRRSLDLDQVICLASAQGNSSITTASTHDGDGSGLVVLDELFDVFLDHRRPTVANRAEAPRVSPASLIVSTRTSALEVDSQCGISFFRC